MNQLPPPPRRVIPTASTSTSTTIDSTSSSSTTTSTSFWNRTKQISTASWNGLYKVSDAVGGWSNTQTAKLGVEAFYPTGLDIECSKAARILRTFTVDLEDQPQIQESLIDSKKTQKVIKQIPKEVLRNCEGLAIFTVMRTGFMVSGASGSGVVLSRLMDGTWSAPSGILLHTIGVGFMLGVDVEDVVLILRTRKAVESFTHPRVSLGGEISVTVGPVGNGFELTSSLDITPVWSYVKSKGLWGGASVVGNILIERNDENRRSYGREIKASEILGGEVTIPYWVEGLHQTILAAEGKAHLADRIPKGLSAAQSVETIEPRRLPPEDLDDEDIRARKEMEALMLDFGIEDPTINDQLRQDDALLLQGADLDILTSPDFPSTRSRTGSATSSLYHQATSSSNPSPLRINSTSAPPQLPPRVSIPVPTSPQFINHSHSLSPASNSNSSLNITTSSNGLLTEVLEHPPSHNNSEENLGNSGIGNGGVGRRSSLDKPKVPPRRSRSVLGGSISGLTEVEKEEEKPVEGDGNKVEVEEKEQKEGEMEAVVEEKKIDVVEGEKIEVSNGIAETSEKGEVKDTEVVESVKELEELEKVEEEKEKEKVVEVVV